MLSHQAALTLHFVVHAFDTPTLIAVHSLYTAAVLQTWTSGSLLMAQFESDHIDEFKAHLEEVREVVKGKWVEVATKTKKVKNWCVRPSLAANRSRRVHWSLLQRLS